MIFALPLNHQPGAWNDFVDRYLGLIYHVVHHTAHLAQQLPSAPKTRKTWPPETFGRLRSFPVITPSYAPGSSKASAALATYLTVSARRICVHELARRTAAKDVQPSNNPATPLNEVADSAPAPKEEPGKSGRSGKTSRQAARQGTLGVWSVCTILQGRSYEEISTALNIPVNSIGPILARARKKLREGAQGIAAGQLPRRAAVYSSRSA